MWSAIAAWWNAARATLRLFEGLARCESREVTAPPGVDALGGAGFHRDGRPIQFTDPSHRDLGPPKDAVLLYPSFLKQVDELEMLRVGGGGSQPPRGNERAYHRIQFARE